MVLATRIAIIVILAVLMEVAPRAGLVSQLILVPVSAMVRALVALVQNPELWDDLLSTVGRVGTSFIAAVITGIPAGWALWRLPRFHALLAPYLASYFALPIFAFYPLLIALFGLGPLPMILVGYLWSVIAVAESAAAGFQQIPETFHKIVRVYRLSRWKALTRVYVPATARSVFGGVKLAASYSMIGVIASEFVLSTNGIGRRILYYFQDFQLEAMYASIFLILIIQVIVISGIGLIERRIEGPRSLP